MSASGARLRLGVVIAAHNEEAVIGRCLRRLLADAGPDEFDVVVVANGCTDRTAEIARGFPGVRVIELDRAGKAGALNAGDRASEVFPRLYLDADVLLGTADARALGAALTRSVLAVAPRRVLDTTGRPALVRAYYAINGRLPAFRGALFGRGAVALSGAGRATFPEFPELLADDLYLNSIFDPGQRREVAAAAAVIATPLRSIDLLRRLTRVRAANAALRSHTPWATPARRLAWLRDVVAPEPRLWPAAPVYLGFTLAAALAGRRPGAARRWARDDSSRTPEPVR